MSMILLKHITIMIIYENILMCLPEVTDVLQSKKNHLVHRLGPAAVSSSLDPTGSLGGACLLSLILDLRILKYAFMY